MSFKTKRWAELRRMNLAERITGVRNTQEGGAVTRSWVLPWQGKFIICAYDTDSVPFWCVYDPATDTLGAMNWADEYVSSWDNYSYFSGWDRRYNWWGDAFLVAQPMPNIYYMFTNVFYGWDADFNFYAPDMDVAGKSATVPAGALCWTGEWPSVIVYSRDEVHGYLQEIPLAGEVLTHVVDTNMSLLYTPSHDGMMMYQFHRFGDYWQWPYKDGEGNTHWVVYGAPPRNGSEHGYLAEYEQIAQHGGPAGTDSWLKVYPLGSIDFYVARESNPFEQARDAWWTKWQYRRAPEAYLCEGDIDGIDHGVTAAPPQTEKGATYNAQLGWWVGVSDSDLNNPLTFTVYVLDAKPPAAMTRKGRTAFVAPAAFVGELAVADDLTLRHVLPLPGSRTPILSEAPAQEKADGHILTRAEIFEKRGNAISYLRDTLVQFAGYSFGSDWWFPGENVDHTFDGWWDVWAGGKTTIAGRWPDPMFGGLNPLGQDAKYGLGIPEEALEAEGTTPTHVVRQTGLMADTSSIAQPQTVGSFRQYRVMRGSYWDERFTYVEWGANMQEHPEFRAVAGRVVGGNWETLVDWNALGSPGLGETSWTVQSVAPIPACAPLPAGGYLVGAELYFDFWDEWEWVLGGREATFRDTGQSWIPAKAGFIGPLEIEDWEPELLGAYDEWTVNRSYYGPHALLVYDAEGNFVECLNSAEVYPPDGREVTVLPGGNLRVMFRVQGGGVYSDSAEYWGAWHGPEIDGDIQAPLYAVYDLLNEGQFVPGMGSFRGFVDMHELAEHDTKDADWRWGAVSSTYWWDDPKNRWLPYAHCAVREAGGGTGVTLLSPAGSAALRTGVRGRGTR